MKVELIRIQNVLSISKNIRVMVFSGHSIINSSQEYF